MTSRSLTFFSAVFVLAAPWNAAAVAATVTGKVELRDSHDPAVRKKRDFSGVIVWLDPMDRTAPPRSPGRAKMIQKDKTFTPHVLAVPVGATVDFPNFDPIFHNAFSNYDGQIFDVGLYPPGSTRAVKFSRPGLVRVFCNIHAAMSAVIVVLNTTAFATSDASGSFSIADIAAGEYAMRIFHERATQAELDQAKRRVLVDNGNNVLPTIVISEGGYISIQHKNKYGHDYPPPPGEGGLYPGARK